MRSILFSIASLALIATVNGKWDIGTCRTDIKTIDYATYSTKPTVPVVHTHKIGAIDHEFKDFIYAIQSFGFKLPLNIYCDDLGSILPFSTVAKAQQTAANTAKASQKAADGIKFFYTADLFKTIFPERKDAIAKLVRSTDYTGTF